MTTKIKIKGSSTTTPTNLEHREPSVSFTDGRCKLLIGNVFGDAIELTDGANIKNTPAGNIASSTVQNAINELDSEKLAKSSNLSDVANRQTSLNNITDVSSATNEYVLTKDTATGNAIFKPSVGGGSASTIATTATTGGTTTLTASSANIQRFTGTAGQILVLPDATTLTNAKSFDILNDCTTATGAISIRTNGGAYLTLVPQTGKATIILEDNGTTAGVWSVEVSVPNISGLTIINSANSFIAGQYLTNGASTYVLAQSNSQTTLPCIARVISANENQYAIFTSGVCSTNLGLDSGLTANTSYIISNITAGAVIAYPATPSDGQLIQPVFEASSATSGVFNPLTVSTWNVSTNLATFTTQGVDYLSNLIKVSNNVGSPNDTIDFGAGTFTTSSGNQIYLPAITKKIQSSGTWTAGTGNNGLDTGARTASTFYRTFVIQNNSTLAYDILFSVSATSPTVPSGYTNLGIMDYAMIRVNGSTNISASKWHPNDKMLVLGSGESIQAFSSTAGSGNALIVNTTEPLIFEVRLYLSTVTTGGSDLAVYGTEQSASDFHDCVGVATNNAFQTAGGGSVYTSDGKIYWKNFSTAGGVASQICKIKSIKIRN